MHQSGTDLGWRRHEAPQDQEYEIYHFVGFIQIPVSLWVQFHTHSYYEVRLLEVQTKVNIYSNCLNITFFEKKIRC